MNTSDKQTDTGKSGKSTKGNQPTSRRTNMATRNQSGKAGNGNAKDAKTNPETIKGALEDIKQEGQNTQPPKADEGKQDGRFTDLSLNTYIGALKRALTYGKQSLQLEMAVSLSVFANFGGVNLNAKSRIEKLYEQAGYDVDFKKEGGDYKTVRRRIDAAGKLFAHLSADYDVKPDAIKAITAHTNEMDSIDALVNHLAEMKFTSLSGMLQKIGATPAKAGTRGGNRKTAANKDGSEKPEGNVGGRGHNSDEYRQSHGMLPDQATSNDQGAGKGEGATQGDKALAASLGESVDESRRDRRATDSDAAKIITTKNLHLAVPPDIDPFELMDMAAQIQMYAKEINENRLKREQEEDRKVARRNTRGKSMAH